MIIDIRENNVRIGVEFSELNREKGFDDDIRISLSEPGQRNTNGYSEATKLVFWSLRHRLIGSDMHC